MKKLGWERLWDVLFPPKCPLCGGLVRKNGILCPDCQASLPRAKEPGEVPWGGTTLLCAAPFYYEGRLRQGFLKYKFQGQRQYAALFGSFLTQAVAEQLDGDWDLVTWAPLNRRRLGQRGYDQARLLAEVVSRGLGVPLVPTLVKEKNTRPQSSLRSEAERAQNAQGAYRLAKGAPVTGQRVLLVDDILTTGSTLSACAQVLLEGGAARVDCGALARHRPEENG